MAAGGLPYKIAGVASTSFAEGATTQAIIGAFFEVYNRLGFGFLESVYASALECELAARGHGVVRELNVRVFYKGEQVGHHRLDMVVDDRVVVELKSTALLPPIARRQLHNYLKATTLEVGLLLHFGEKPRVFRSFVPHRSPHGGWTATSAPSVVDLPAPASAVVPEPCAASGPTP